MNIYKDVCDQAVLSSLPQAIMVVYDITDEKSFKSVSKWLQDIDQVLSNDVENSACT